MSNAPPEETVPTSSIVPLWRDSTLASLCRCLRSPAARRRAARPLSAVGCGSELIEIPGADPLAAPRPFCYKTGSASNRAPIGTEVHISRRLTAMATNGPLNRKLRMALVGGGQGSFIGRVHATAAVLDNRAALVAGALSSDPAKGQSLGRRLRHSRPIGLMARIANCSTREKKLPAERADRFRLRRHAEPHPLRDRQGGGGGRLQRHLRQADDVRPEPGRAIGRRGRSLGRRVRA